MFKPQKLNKATIRSAIELATFPNTNPGVIEFLMLPAESR